MPERRPGGVDALRTRVFRVPTDGPESDGTFAWTTTTVVVVEVDCGSVTGLGYTYGPTAVAALIEAELADIVRDGDPLTPQRTWAALHAALRNAGQGGIGALAIAALDIALHDLRARMLDLPLSVSLGAVRDAVEIYGSGGFTSYGPAQTAEQLAGWVGQGIGRVKMKVGRRPEADLARLAAVRTAIGPDIELMVDANGAFTPAAARHWAQRYADFAVTWLEEPVTQDDPGGLADVRARAPAGMAVASGEYSWSRFDSRRLLDAEAVDVLQADVTRCGGLTELLRIDALCAAANRPLSLHCAPAISAHAGTALTALLHLEYFHDHQRIERLLFDGVLDVDGGTLRPDRGRAGHGLSVRDAEARRYAVS
ncbi:enolase C-terminal domain-like protein [Conexibacter sp. DBS9H8]|uniref:enolase C-terminal domain-like protein n=1 Tax=Conexibacter sp. DBS9H8 TaxID=2937801 RepID=UPI00200E8DB7|nr:enolase C-terminal domain-like protein [Conexibacter sp. DBS9H8]